MKYFMWISTKKKEISQQRCIKQQNISWLLQFPQWKRSHSWQEFACALRSDSRSFCSSLLVFCVFFISYQTLIIFLICNESLFYYFWFLLWYGTGIINILQLAVMMGLHQALLLVISLVDYVRSSSKTHRILKSE